MNELNAKVEGKTKSRVKLADIKTKDHMGMIRWLGRTLALPLMLLFSVGALTQLAGKPLGDMFQMIGSILGYLFSGFQSNLEIHQDPVQILLALFALGLVVGMDIIMLISADNIITKMQQGESRKEYMFDIILVGFVALVETVTYILLLIRTENPAPIVANGQFNGQSFASWILILLRAASAPVTSIVLATMRDKIPSEKDMMHNLAMEVANAINAALQKVKANSDIEYLPVLFPFYHMLNGSLTQDKKTEIKELVTNIESIMPDAVKVKAAEEVQRIKTESEQQIRQMEERINTMEQRVKEEHERAETDASSHLLQAIMWLSNTGELPSWFLDKYPNLTGFTFQFSSKSRAKGNISGTLSTPKPITNTDNLRDILTAIGVQEEPKPDPKSRYIWVLSPDINKIAGRELENSERSKLSLELSKRSDNSGECYRKGKMYIVPLQPLIRVLASRNQLHKDLLVWWLAQNKEPETSDVEQDSEGTIPSIVEA